jgi:heme-degrading monooxygenase HmoA
MYVILWEYSVAEDKRAAFLELYGPRGEWERLFRGHEGWMRSELLRDDGTPGRYVSVDRWSSRELYERFLERSKADFERIDQLGQALTDREEQLGRFETNS